MSSVLAAVLLYFNLMPVPFILSSFIVCFLAKWLLEQDFLYRSCEGFKRPKEKPHSLSAGSRLYRELLGLNRNCLAGGSCPELSRYKYFTALAEKLFAFYRSGGGDIFPLLLQTRKNLMFDLRAEKKTADISRSALAEMGVVMLMGAVFLLFAGLYARLETSAVAAAAVFAWQSAGAGVLLWGAKALKRRIFAGFSGCVKRACALDVLLKTGRPINVVAKETDLENFPADPSLAHIKERMEEILYSAKRSGYSDSGQTKELLTECWFSHDLKLEKYILAIKRLKLFVMAAFFLTGYLFLFFSLVSSVGAESAAGH